MIVKLSRFHFVVLMLAVLLAAMTVGICTNRITVAASIETAADLPVVMYHHITEDESKAGKYVVTVETLESDLRFLSERGYESVSVEQLVKFAKGEGKLPEKPIMLTFDDGFESVGVYAPALLEKYSMTAQVFAVGSIADYYSSIDDHNLAYSYLTWDELAQMSKSGLFEIQNHTDNLHTNTAARNGAKKNKNESPAQYKAMLTADLRLCQRKIKDCTGVEATAFAYPFGSFSAETSAAVRELGFSAVFTCEEKVNKINNADSEWLFGIGRFNRGNDISSAAFFEKLGIQ